MQDSDCCMWEVETLIAVRHLLRREICLMVSVLVLLLRGRTATQ